MFVAIVKSVQLSAALKTTPPMARRSQNHGTNDTPLTPKALVETIQKIVKKELAANEIVIKEMINANKKMTL